MSVGYLLWVAAGIVAAAIASRWQGRSTALEPGTRQAVLLAAFAGAVLGAVGLQLPADLMGFSAPTPAGSMGDAMPLGGRTVIGGLLGGWLAVEGMKKLAGVKGATGGDFALPLAIALGFGRLGCLTAGCCAGIECAPSCLASVDANGTPRVPIQAIEAIFHFAAACLLAVAAKQRRAAGSRLAAYLACYAILRFLLEFWRQHPPIAWGLSWYQWLTIALFALAASTFYRRTRQPIIRP